MIHAVCDFCGKDCKRTANFITITPLQNFPRYHTDVDPLGHKDEPRSFICCSNCRRKHNLPNPYEDYDAIDNQNMSYTVHLDKPGAERTVIGNMPLTDDQAEMVGQLMDQIEDYLSDESGEPEAVRLEGGQYERLSRRIAQTLLNWNAMPVTVPESAVSAGKEVNHAEAGD